VLFSLRNKVGSGFSVWLTSCNAHVFVLHSVATVTDQLHPQLQLTWAVPANTVCIGGSSWTQWQRTEFIYFI